MKIKRFLFSSLKYNFLIRAKLNCYTIKSKHIHTEMHRDYSFDHQVALFSFNTCNGFTYFEEPINELWFEKVKITPKKGKTLVFKSDVNHGAEASFKNKRVLVGAIDKI